jgi:diphthamide synthase (EF-2-diphthine--ammonia ligase)
VEKVLISWSGGKDCALALHEILSNKEYQVAELLTTITGNTVAHMHDVGSACSKDRSPWLF